MVLVGILSLIGCGALPILLISVVIHQYEIACWLGDRFADLRARRRRRQIVPLGRPIQDIAVDLRRLGNRFEHVPRGMSFARFDATRRAYDDVLVESCRALGITERFSALPPGAARDLQRRNAEFQLEQAGLRLRDAA